MFARLFNRRSIAAWGYLVATIGSGFVLLFLVARVLPAEQAGVWFAIQSAATFVALGDFGVGFAIMRIASSRSNSNRISNGRWGTATVKVSVQDVSTLKVVRLLTGVASTTFAVALTTLVIVPLSLQPGIESSQALWCWAFYAAGTVLSVVGSGRKSLLESAGLLHTERSISMATHLAASIGIVVLLVTIEDPLGPMGAAMLAGSILNLILLEKAVKRHLIVAEAPTFAKGAKGVLREGLAMFWTTAGATATRSSYSLVASTMLGAAVLAPIYFLVRVFSVAATAIAIPITADRAILSALFGSGEIGALRRHLAVSMTQTTLLSALFSLLLWIFFFTVAPILMGSQYSPPPLLFALLSIDLLLNNVSSVCTQYVLSSGRNPFPLSVLAGGIVTLAFLFCFVPIFGIYGAVLAQPVASLLTSYWFNAWQLYLLMRQVSIDKN